jgi:hypothetical protein
MGRLADRGGRRQSGGMTTTLITGANKGLGFETARRLIAAGHTVYAGSRDAERGRRAAGQLGARMVLLDVTDDDSAAAAAKPSRPMAGWTCWSTTPASRGGRRTEGCSAPRSSPATSCGAPGAIGKCLLHTHRAAAGTPDNVLDSFADLPALLELS